MSRALIRFATLLSALLILLTAGAPVALAGTKPPDPYPKELAGARVGINKKTGEYCDQDSADMKIREACRPAMDCEDFPAGGTTVCRGEGLHDPKEAHAFEIRELNRWLKTADHNSPVYEKKKAYLTKCVKEKKETFQACKVKASNEYPEPIDGLPGWIKEKISKMAADAMEQAAKTLGSSVVWLLRQFADAFNSISTISLGKTGIGPIMGITTGISVLVATFLLLVQFSKLAVSQQGGPLVTAITGLAKWAAILSVYLFATQVALNWSDTASTALINYTFEGGGSGAKDATGAMQEQLGTLFAGLVGTGGGAVAGSALITGSGVGPTAVGFVIVISILCILAIGALWVEMLIRQAGIMIIVTVMPLTLAGQMSDATSEWWPKARNALISLILMKPVIVLCFSIGFSSMTTGQGVRNVIVGLIIFIVAGFSWPVLAKFMTFTSNGAGTSTASGAISSVGSSVSSMFGGQQPSLSGPGTVGGGGGYTKALESDNSNSSGGGDKGFWSKAIMGSGSGSFASKVGGTVGAGLQVAAVGKDVLESGFANSAAHAGLDSGAQGGRHVVIPPRRGGEEAALAPQPSPAEPESSSAPETEPSAPAPTQPSSGPAPTQPSSGGS
ncbi:hypothetical protein EES39_38590 [Streptomyces sp. ADI92-24]|uniref:hypothetical protein n=1 Tax=Streptomyces sp. ADI92-24 TaxID=1522756 RepID=UPI000F54DE8C|nr:hypothetical protein [Streptomyces sp. ADI92-24]RPK32398.1 hypothetical protein EES39_38590 [Streptomyces sp. ADI92-24]